MIKLHNAEIWSIHLNSSGPMQDFHTRVLQFTRSRNKSHELDMIFSKLGLQIIPKSLKKNPNNMCKSSGM